MHNLPILFFVHYFVISILHDLLILLDHLVQLAIIHAIRGHTPETHHLLHHFILFRFYQNTLVLILTIQFILINLLLLIKLHYLQFILLYLLLFLLKTPKYVEIHNYYMYFL